jgi:TonB family protein
MKRRSAGRGSLALVLSVAFHVLFAVGMLFLPEQIRKSYDIVDLSVERKQVEKQEEEQPEPEVEPEEEKPEPDEPKLKPKPKPKPEEEPEPPPAPVPDEEEAPEDAPEAPPVFDLGDNTFAKGDGQGAAWSLNRSEGNTKFAAVAGKNQKPVRNTKPRTDPDGKPGGKGGFKPVPSKNLSERPKPANGPIKIPPYPAEARRDGIEGRVLLQVFIDKKGKVYKVRVLKEPGGGLGKVAREYMFKERWKPARDKSGNPVDTIITYTYTFVLEG